MYGICRIDVEGASQHTRFLREVLEFFESAHDVSVSMPMASLTFKHVNGRTLLGWLARQHTAIRGPAMVVGDAWVFDEQNQALIRKSDTGFSVISSRDMTPIALGLLDVLLCKHRMMLTHAAGVAIGGKGVMLIGWGGVGKTSTLLSLLGASDVQFLGDDAIVLDEGHSLRCFPKPMFIYPYHRVLLPNVFMGIGKPLVPERLLGTVGGIRRSLRPFLRAHPTIEAFARRFTPEHIRVQPWEAIDGLRIATRVPLESIVVLNRAKGSYFSHREIPQHALTALLVGQFPQDLGAHSWELLLRLHCVDILNVIDYLHSRTDLAMKQEVRALEVIVPNKLSASSVAKRVSKLILDSFE